MSDPNHAHEFDPNRKGLCKVIIGGRHCGLPSTAQVHLNWQSKHELEVDGMADLKHGEEHECECCEQARSVERSLSEAEDKVEALEEELKELREAEPIFNDCRRCDTRAILNRDGYCSRDCELGNTIHPLLRRVAHA